MAKDDKIEQLKKQAEELKAKIKAEREAKRDTTLAEACAQVESIQKIAFKAPKKQLRGHLAKIYAMHWATDSRHLVSASQDGKCVLFFLSFFLSFFSFFFLYFRFEAYEISVCSINVMVDVLFFNLVQEN